MLDRTVAVAELGPESTQPAAPSRSLRPSVAKAGKWLFALASIGLLLWWIDWRDSLKLLGRADLGLVLLVLALNVLRIVLSAWKWELLLRALGIRIGLPQAVRIYWIGTFASSFLPSTVGGDFVRTAISRRFAGVGPIAASVIIERLTGMGVLLAFSLIAVLARPDLVAYRPLWTFLVLGMAGFTGGLLLACAFLLLRPQRIRLAPPSPA
jgi:uncharacterized protein (TIRG00374 family)